MSSIRIRKPFAAGFVFLLLAAAYLGLSTQKIPSYGHSDKGLHFVTFFLVTACFYWIIEASRRRVINATLLVCTAGMGIGSEVVQGLLPNGRDFDPLDILANVVGSGLAVFLCGWYHRRMLERKRQSRHYDIVPDDEDLEDGEGDELGRGERDVELGEGVGVRSQETGTVAVESSELASSSANKTDVSDELDNWDENAEDWDDDEPVDTKPSDSKAKESIA